MLGNTFNFDVLENSKFLPINYKFEPENTELRNRPASFYMC